MSLKLREDDSVRFYREQDSLQNDMSLVYWLLEIVWNTWIIVFWLFFFIFPEALDEFVYILFLMRRR